MAECSECGARYSPGEHFCGNCGAQLIPNSPELRTMAATLGDEIDAPQMTSAQLATTLEDAEALEALASETNQTPADEEADEELAAAQPVAEEPVAEEPVEEDHA